MTRDPPLEMRSLCRTFATTSGADAAALIDINLTVFAGDFVVLTGPSGSGKSTLLSIGGCLDSHSSGMLKIFGNPLRSGDTKERARLRRLYVGFIFQDYKLLDKLTVHENVVRPLIFRGVGTKDRKRQADTYLDKVQMWAYRNRFPHQLSGGQKQRVGIARALVTSPSILFADEPTAALDSENADGVLSILSTLNHEGTTIVLATHDARVRERATHVVELADGRISRVTNQSIE